MRYASRLKSKRAPNLVWEWRVLIKLALFIFTPAKLKKSGSPKWTEEKLARLAQQVFFGRCRWNAVPPYHSTNDLHRTQSCGALPSRRRRALPARGSTLRAKFNDLHPWCWCPVPLRRRRARKWTNECTRTWHDDGAEMMQEVNYSNCSNWWKCTISSCSKGIFFASFIRSHHDTWNDVGAGKKSRLTTQKI